MTPPTCRAPGPRGCPSRPAPPGPPGDWPPSPGQVSGARCHVSRYSGARYPGIQVPDRCAWCSTSPAGASPTGQDRPGSPRLRAQGSAGAALWWQGLNTLTEEAQKGNVIKECADKHVKPRNPVCNNLFAGGDVWPMPWIYPARPFRACACMQRCRGGDDWTVQKVQIVQVDTM